MKRKMIGNKTRKSSPEAERLPGNDFYFFGADTPRNVDADNYFYFYPVNKKNVDLVTEKQAVELYDIIEIKIRKTNGEYSIIEDVKNFGSRI